MSKLPTPFADLLKSQQSTELKEEIRQIIKEELKKALSKESAATMKVGAVMAYGIDEILKHLNNIAIAVNAPKESNAPTEKKKTLLEMLNASAIADLPLYRITVKDAFFIIVGSCWGIYGLFSFGHHQMHWW